MKPLFVLLSSFVLSIFVTRILNHSYDLRLSARIAMFLMLLFTAVGHFIYVKGMAMMIPDILRAKTELVYLTGILEILLGIGLLIPDISIYSGWILIVFLMLILPANINAALKNIDYQTGTHEGSGIYYLLFRIPLQALFIIWTYLSCIKI